MKTLAAKKKHDKYNTLKGAAAWIGLITSRPDRFERAPEIEPTAQVERTKDVILAWHKRPKFLIQVKDTKSQAYRIPIKGSAKAWERERCVTYNQASGGGGGGGINDF